MPLSKYFFNVDNQILLVSNLNHHNSKHWAGGCNMKCNLLNNKKGLLLVIKAIDWRILIVYY